MRSSSLASIGIPAVAILLLTVTRGEAQQPYSYGAPARSRSNYSPPASGAVGGVPQYQGKAAAAAQATARSNQINQGTVGSVPMGTNGQAGSANGGPRINYANPNLSNTPGYGTTGSGYSGPAYGAPGNGVTRGNGAAASRSGATRRPTQGSTPEGNLPNGGVVGDQVQQFNPKAAAAAQAAARADQLNQGNVGQGAAGALNPTGNGGSYVPQPGDGLGPADLADNFTGDDDVSWRYRYHNGSWWYWGENNQWMYHRNGKWNSFAGAANVAPGASSLNPNGPFDPNSPVNNNPNVTQRSFSSPYTRANGRVMGQYDPRTDYRNDPRTSYSNQFRTNTPYAQQVDPRLKNALPGRRLDVLYPNDISDAYRGYRTNGAR